MALFLLVKAMHGRDWSRLHPLEMNGRESISEYSLNWDESFHDPTYGPSRFSLSCAKHAAEAPLLPAN